MSTLGYALLPSGCLVLGTSETLGTMAEYFAPLDTERRIFCRKPEVRNSAFDLHISPWLWQPESAADATAPEPPNRSLGAFAVTGIERYVDRMLLNEYGPAGILINDQGRVVEFRGNAGRYLGNDRSSRPERTFLRPSATICGRVCARRSRARGRAAAYTARKIWKCGSATAS